MKKSTFLILGIIVLLSSCSFFEDKYEIITPKPIYIKQVIPDIAQIRYFQEGINDSLHTKFIVDNVFERSGEIGININVFDTTIFKTKNIIVSKQFSILLDDTADSHFLTSIIKSNLILEQIEAVVFNINDNTAVDFGGLYDANYTFIKDETQLQQDFAYFHIDYQGNFKLRFKHTSDSLYAEGRIRNDSTLEYALLRNIETNEVYTEITSGTDKQFENDSLHFSFTNYISKDSINKINIKLFRK